MAEMDTSTGGGHKKTRCQKRKKTFYPCGFNSHGGSGFPAYHLLHFYHYHESANSNETVPAQGRKQTRRAE